MLTGSCRIFPAFRSIPSEIDVSKADCKWINRKGPIRASRIKAGRPFITIMLNLVCAVVRHVACMRARVSLTRVSERRSQHKKYSSCDNKCFHFALSEITITLSRRIYTASAALVCLRQYYKRDAHTAGAERIGWMVQCP